jgi:predicted RNase H-like HicB family nuclease
MNEARWERAEKLARRPYSVELSRDELSDGQTIYVARNPALPGCKSQGITIEEALENLNAARMDYIYFLLEDGLPVPDPMQTTTSTSITNNYIFTYTFGETAANLVNDTLSDDIPGSTLIESSLRLAPSTT